MAEWGRDDGGERRDDGGFICKKIAKSPTVIFNLNYPVSPVRLIPYNIPVNMSYLFEKLIILTRF